MDSTRRAAERSEAIRIRMDFENDRDMIYLPEVSYYDTQAGAVEIGLDRETVVSLHMHLGLWLKAVEGPAACPGESRDCNCTCEGCKYHCSAHQPTTGGGTDGESDEHPGADPLRLGAR